MASEVNHMRYDCIPLKDLVQYFVSEKKETDCWDFKQEWHENNADLIKDIICFANTVHDENCYIIFGVSDDYQLTGMTKARRKQADIVDTLSSLKFAGDNLPDISIETIQINGVTIDVLIIHNTTRTPIYLKTRWGNMHAGCVYLRKGDRNTPDNSNAEIEDIENLWRKRFGLTKPPLEYLYDRLQNRLEWAECDGQYYNIYKPEFSLKKHEYDGCYDAMAEYYAYTQTNEATSYLMLDVMISGTTVANHQLVCLDSGRLILPVPEWGFIGRDHYHTETLPYKFYILGTPKYRLLQFLYNPENSEERWAFDLLMDVVLIFVDEDEKEIFEAYIQRNYETVISNIERSNEYEYIRTDNEKKTKEHLRRLRAGVVLKRLLSEWRESLRN